MNKLIHAKSPYLRHAAHQKIDWYPWSEEAFERARAEDKPVFLSTGAVWCHWCHVMAKESFEDDETARLLNELFVCVKLDRDEYPDIDRRYQQAVAAMSSAGGWPLSVFLTPDKQPFFGGTYFPPRDMQGRPGFKQVLRVVSNFYKTEKSNALSYAARLMDALKPPAAIPASLDPALLHAAEESMLAAFDSENGGFGSAPKFPLCGAISFLLLRSARNPDSAAGRAVRMALDAMARGGFYDQLGGGFHRYSTDKAWMVPHFEKMADDNAELLKSYIHASVLFEDERLRTIVRGIIAYVEEVLSDPQGGFYASQDADVTPDDEGGYFTWTHDEFKSVLNTEEYQVLSAFFLNDRGMMHHDPEKIALSSLKEPEEIAEELGKSLDEIRNIMTLGREKLLSARMKRQAPFIDRTLYTSLNGMLIGAFFRVAAVLGNEEILQFAVLSLERILKERLTRGTLQHAENVPALLDDYVYLIDALVSGYEATANRRYLDLADDFMAVCREKFYDQSEGGFFDTENDVLGMRLKRIEDVPHPSANAAAVLLLLKLSFMKEKPSYRRMAEQTLELFGGPAAAMGIHAGAYFCALEAWFHMIHLTIEAAPDSPLAQKAVELAATRSVAVLYGEDHGRVVLCKEGVCLEPVTDPARLKDVLPPL